MSIKTLTAILEIANKITNVVIICLLAWVALNILDKKEPKIKAAYYTYQLESNAEKCLELNIGSCIKALKYEEKLEKINEKRGI